jgi:phosphatidate cytidylyltransferase
LKRGGDSLVAGAYLLGGPIYIGFPLGHALLFRDLGPDWLLFALLVTFATDTGAFFTGRSIGRHQMAPTISPSKTWEGAAGGFALATVVALILGLVGEYGHTPLQLALSLWQEAIIGATVGVVSQLGDLFESKLKRLSHAKDAGSIIPGHGGILDRLDSIVTSVPVVYYLVAVVFKP